MLEGFTTISTAVDENPTVILTQAQARGADSLGRDEVHFVRVRNAGTEEIDVFDGTIEDGNVIFGDGWGPIAAGGWLTFNIDRGDVPLNGLKAICDTGKTSTAKTNRG